MMSDITMSSRYAVLIRDRASQEWEVHWWYDELGDEDRSIEDCLCAFLASRGTSKSCDGVAAWDFYTGDLHQVTQGGATRAVE